MSSPIIPSPVWLDCDPGHDDAIAILLALNLPQINLLGISTVSGNGSLAHTTSNAARLLAAFTTPQRAAQIPIFEGAEKPLIRGTKHDEEIHGTDGLGGVIGLPSSTSPAVLSLLPRTTTSPSSPGPLLSHLSQLLSASRAPITIIATGPLTNIALFVQSYPNLVRTKVKEIILMGGSEGRGNRSPTAEFNILCDPEAAKIVFDAECKVVMMPLNVTHTALFTPKVHQKLLDLPTSKDDPAPSATSPARTPLRFTLSTLLTFFAATYAKVFAFHSGPPVHDPLCVAYVSHPHLFKGKRYRVDCETKGEFTAGTTVVDLWDYRESELVDWKKDPESRESWGKFGKNVWVAESVEVDEFWNVFLLAVENADQVSPLNV